MRKKAASEVDYLSVVRARLSGMSRPDMLRIAAELDIDPRTLDNIAKGSHDPKYGTVLKSYRAIQRLDGKASHRKTVIKT